MGLKNQETQLGSSGIMMPLSCYGPNASKNWDSPCSGSPIGKIQNHLKQIQVKFPTGINFQLRVCHEGHIIYMCVYYFATYIYIHYITLHYIALHCITLHYITLHLHQH